MRKDLVSGDWTHYERPAFGYRAEVSVQQITCLTCARRSRASSACGVISDVLGSSMHLTLPSD
jgi:hypothetical protein